MNLSVLGLQLAANRRRAGLTQGQLARRMGSTQPAIARIESGAARPSLDYLDRFVRATRIPIVIELPIRAPMPLSRAARRERVRRVVGDGFDPWLRNPNKLERRALEAAGLTPESFQSKKTASQG